MSEQPVTFASLKDKLINHNQHKMQDGDVVMLESLEQRVRELRDGCKLQSHICDDHGPGHEGNCRCYKSLDVLAGKLNVLLGGQ